ncbi:hypothetical protein [Candidatus Palauibacter sp.]|uniref:hypothetical protein n=1 Tax=Candidatus Palauibacter sp. TaxID=3101350 RepID=UPI003CC66198
MVEAGQVVAEQPLQGLQVRVEFGRQLVEHRPVGVERRAVAPLQVAAQAGQAIVQLDGEGDLVLRALVPELVELSRDRFDPRREGGRLLPQGGVIATGDDLA